MLILITNNTLDVRAGSELYLRDVAIRLLKLGHSPVAYSQKLGEVAKELRAATIPVIDNLDALATVPNVIHGHHHLETMTALLHFPRVPAVFFCHGWLPWEETPPLFPRILRYVAVDQPCRDRLILESGVASDRVKLLLNFVDLQRFQTRDPLPPRPRRALVFSNYASEQTHIPAVRQACARHGIDLDVVGAGSGNVCENPEDVLGGYDIVFAKGRSALESLAVGTAVIVCDSIGVGPMVTTGELQQLRLLNFGVRALRERVSADVLEQQIARYDASDAAEVSQLIRKTAGRDETVEQIVELYREVIEENKNLQTLEPDEEGRAAAAYLRSVGSLVKAVAEVEQRAGRAEAALANQREAGASSSSPLETVNQIQELQSTLAQRDAQLEQIQRSLGWRMLNRYGPIKYRFVLPVYKRLGRILKSGPGKPADLNETPDNSEVVISHRPNSPTVMSAIFSDIYQRRAWGEDCESVSGPGSSLARTAYFRDELAGLLERLEISTLLDAGCGDFNWMKHTIQTLDQFVGVDVVPEIVEENQTKYGAVNCRFLHLDITTDKINRADLILSRDCLVHLSFSDVFAAIRNFKQSGSKYLLATTFRALDRNSDISTGGWRPLDLQQPPFDFPEPLELIDERRLDSQGHSSEKYLGLWRLDDISI